jgi:hypothetical protein
MRDKMAGWQDGRMRDRMAQLFVDYSYWLIIGYYLFRDANVMGKNVAWPLSLIVVLKGEVEACC